MKKLLAKIYQLSYPLALAYWFIFRPHTEGVRCIIRSDDQILLIKHTYGPDLYTVPGGGIHKNESKEDAVRREIREEVRLQVTDLKLLTRNLYTKEYKKDTVHLFTATTDTANITIDQSELKEAAWFPIQKLPENIYPNLKKHLHALLKSE